VRLDPDALERPENAPDMEAIRRALSGEGYAEAELSREGAAIRLRTAPLDVTKQPIESHEARIKTIFEKNLSKVLSNPFPFRTSIGASVAHNLKSRAIVAIVLSLVMMSIYIAFRFDFKAGLAATLCLFHDVSAAMGVLMVLDMTSKWTGLDAKINLGTIAAFLTIVGFSINDTIVTFDRMRENLGQAPPKDRNQYEATLERSINQTLSRTVLTSFTVFLVLVVLALAGVPSLMGFTLALLAGVVFGTFSSIAVATPILLSEPRRLATIVAAEFIVFVGLGIAGGYLRL
jgi:preprotein translocase SecF subunit